MSLASCLWYRRRKGGLWVKELDQRGQSVGCFVEDWRHVTGDVLGTPDRHVVTAAEFHYLNDAAQRFQPFARSLRQTGRVLALELYAEASDKADGYVGAWGERADNWLALAKDHWQRAAMLSQLDPSLLPVTHSLRILQNTGDGFNRTQFAKRTMSHWERYYGTGVAEHLMMRVSF